MKKYIAILMAMAMVLSLAACGANGEPDETITPIEGPFPTVNQEAIRPDPTEMDLPQSTTAPAAADAATVTVLQNIWNKYAEEEKFPVAGGNVEAGIMGEPGAWDMAYAENMTYNLLVPAEQLATVSEAASLIHMMNANSFTCGAFALTEGSDVNAFADAMQAAVQGNQWMCGFPETLVIAVVDSSYVVVAFGLNELMTPFQTHLTEAYPGAEILYNEAIAG